MSTETPSSMLPRVEATDFFALRTPLLSHDELTAWCDGLQSAISSNDPDRLREALAKDRQLLRARLRTIALRPEVREALFLASASLEASLPIWLESPDSERGQKVERSLVKYFLRMTTRPTPFGLFAGCSLGSIGASTQFRLTGLANYRRDVRLDGDYLSALATELGRSSALRRTLVFRPNSSLYQVGERLRYAKVNLGEKRSYNLVLVVPDDGGVLASGREPLRGSLSLRARRFNANLAQKAKEGERKRARDGRKRRRTKAKGA